MSKQYLHLSTYPCDSCAGPVVSGSLAVRESVISKETDIRQIGAICIACGSRPGAATELANARHLMPMEWDPAGSVATRQTVSALNRAEPH
jgi:hypothetical protein